MLRKMILKRMTMRSKIFRRIIYCKNYIELKDFKKIKFDFRISEYQVLILIKKHQSDIT